MKVLGALSLRGKVNHYDGRFRYSDNLRYLEASEDADYYCDVIVPGQAARECWNMAGTTGQVTRVYDENYNRFHIDTLSPRQVLHAQGLGLS
jgi:hypothetical protein